MTILSDFEDRVTRAVEGVFAGVFRSPVQPAEMARACAKEMDRRRKLGVGKVYAPTMYSVLLSHEDGEQLGGFSDTLAGELETYLVSYAAERSYELAARPHVRFLIDEDLKLGRFEVIGELLSPEEIAEEVGPPPGDDTYFHPDAEPAGEPPAPESPSGSSAIPTVTVPGVEHDIALAGERMVIGRLKACDICLPDANASREHAALEREGMGWAAVDLGSTNGTLVNGEKIDRVRLLDGDVITVGITELVYHEPRG